MSGKREDHQRDFPRGKYSNHPHVLSAPDVQTGFVCRTPRPGLGTRADRFGIPRRPPPLAPPVRQARPKRAPCGYGTGARHDGLAQRARGPGAVTGSGSARRRGPGRQRGPVRRGRPSQCRGMPSGAAARAAAAARASAARAPLPMPGHAIRRGSQGGSGSAGRQRKRKPGPPYAAALAPCRAAAAPGKRPN